ncbi:MAG: energy transducer TonB, partial [Pseudomonadota bacterium]
PPPQRPQPQPQHQAPPRQQAPQPSPLTNPSRPRAPGDQQQASRQAPTFQNPADVYGQRRAEDEYIWYVARKISQHQQFIRNAVTEAGTVILRLVIARDGRLVNVAIARSSGVASLDNASLNMIRQAAPYPPLPPQLAGSQHTFTLPLYFRRNE